MLWSEFVDNTKCKVTEHNFEIYKALESLYMLVEDMPKSEIYQIGKRCVDNSLTVEEIKNLQKIKDNKTSLEMQLDMLHEDRDRLDECCAKLKGTTEYSLYEYYRKMAKSVRTRLKEVEVEYKTMLSLCKPELKQIKENPEMFT